MSSQEKKATKKAAVKVGPAVIWTIPRTDYFMESTGDGLPIFHHHEFTFKAVAPGSGNIAWYIACTERNAPRPCPVQGVRNKDGRLMMLRSHNHLQRTAKQKRKSSNPATSSNDVDSSPPVKKSPRLSMPEAIRDRWQKLTSPKPKVQRNSGPTLTSPKPKPNLSSPCESDCEVSFNDSALPL